MENNTCPNEEPRDDHCLEPKWLEQHRAHRRLLIELGVEQARSFDKHALALSTAAIALSLLFVKELSVRISIVHVECLAWSWVLLVTTVLSTLLSFVFGRLSCYREAENLDRELEEVTSADESAPDHGNAYTRVAEVLNFITAVAFVIGVALFLIFAIENIGELSRLHSPTG